MKFGILMEMSNSDRVELSYEDRYARSFDIARQADELGIDNIWLPEHHFLPDGYISSPLTVAAALLARTSRIRVGSYVHLMPLHNPLEVAEAAAACDAVSNGRFDLGLGQGYRPEEFTNFAIQRKERGPRLEEGALLVRKLLSETDVTFHGRFYHCEHASVYPRPVQKPIPIWLAARSDAALDRVARAGFNLAGDGVPEHARTYIESLRTHGRDPRDFRIAQLRFGYIAPTREKAWDDCERHVHYLINRYIVGVKQDWPPIAAGAAILSDLPPVGELRKRDTATLFGGPWIVGTPEDAIRMIEESYKAQPFSHLVLNTMLPGMDPAHAMSSIRLLAREVMPHFRDHQ